MRPPSLPLRRPADNPFAVQRLHRLQFRSPDWSWADFDRRLASAGGRGAVIGPKGSGKTTLIEELARRTNGTAVRIFIAGDPPTSWREVQRQLPQPVAGGHIVFVDGFKQLGGISQRRLLRSVSAAGALVVTAHEPVGLPTLIRCRTDVALLRDLVRELAPDDASALEPHLDDLFHRHGGNLRECFRELYDLYAGRAIWQVRS